MTALAFVSTRGRAAELNFEQATLTGLATDGGLYVPKQWPSLSPQELQRLDSLSYTELAFAILSRFTAGCVAADDLRRLLDQAYAGFGHAAVAPLKQLDTNLYIMELFHGPTLAFKDFALQFLGRLFQHFLARQQRRCTILGATSGDTGSAAIEAMRGLDAVQLFMLHPHARVSDIQRKQMTTVTADNIHNLAVDGTFDDCQNLVKAVFNDLPFRHKHGLAAVNSINWARIAAQVVYYFRAAVALGAATRPVNFAVPTGNFGNVFAGYVAKQMGLRLNKLIIGSNRNDILTRFFQHGRMQQHGVHPTLSPSMDIQISSNFERFLFELLGRDSEKVTTLMQQFAAHGEFSVSAAELARAKQTFCAHRLSDHATRAELSRVYAECGEILDPHSAIGVAAAREHAEAGVPTVVLATAHAAKFGDAVTAAIGQPPPLPPRLQALLQRPEKLQQVPNDRAQLQALIERVNPAC